MDEISPEPVRCLVCGSGDDALERRVAFALGEISVEVGAVFCAPCGDDLPRRVMELADSAPGRAILTLLGSRLGLKR